MEIRSFLLFLAYYVQNVNSDVILEISNREPGPIWIGIMGNQGHPHLNNGGFALNQAQTVEVSAPDNWAGRIWPRTWCDPNSKHCETGDCGNKLECRGTGGTPPATFVEITLKGWKGFDYYDISLVEGFNLRAFVEPVNGIGPRSHYSCSKAKCLPDINTDCPNDLRLIHAGQTIACHSACTKFKSDMYCCKGKHDRPETCNSQEWPKNFPAFFRSACPDAYSFAYDDSDSMFSCKANRYRIYFGNSY